MSVVALEVAQGIGVCTPIAPMPGSCVVEFVVLYYKVRCCNASIYKFPIPRAATSVLVHGAVCEYY